LIEVYGDWSPIIPLAALAHPEPDESQLLQAGLGSLRFAPPVELGNPVEVEDRPASRSSCTASRGDILVLPVVFMESPMTATIAAACTSTEGTVVAPLGVLHGVLPAPDDSASVREFAGGYLVFAQARKPGQALIRASFRRVVSWVTVEFDVTVDD
jgi:hypothetical protein